MDKAIEVIATGLTSFLGRICNPAAEELGYLLQDKVRNWRVNNKISTLEKTHKLLLKKYPEQDRIPRANPRAVLTIIDSSGWVDDEHLQDMWAGLLASSFNGDEGDDSNILFANLMNQMTSVQGRLLYKFIDDADIHITEQGLLLTKGKKYSHEEIMVISGVSDINRLDMELDHLSSLDLIGGGFDIRGPFADISLRPLFLHMYARCNGWEGDIASFYDLDLDKDILPDTEYEKLLKSIDEVTESIGSSDK